MEQNTNYLRQILYNKMKPKEKNMKKYILVLTAVFALALIFTGCGNSLDENSDLPEDNPNSADCTLVADIQGEILEINQEDSFYRVLVDSDSDVNGEIWVSLNDETEYVDSAGLSISPENIEDLFEVGQKASIVSTGIIMESYPMQTAAVLVYTNE